MDNTTGVHAEMESWDNESDTTPADKITVVFHMADNRRNNMWISCHDFQDFKSLVAGYYPIGSIGKFDCWLDGYIPEVFEFKKDRGDN
jgi:hypothetical protein